VRTTSGARATSAGAGQSSRLSVRVGAPAQVTGPRAPPAGRTPAVGHRRTLAAASPGRTGRGALRAPRDGPETTARRGSGRAG
jgi:hypothetical protein